MWGVRRGDVSMSVLLVLSRRGSPAQPEILACFGDKAVALCVYLCACAGGIESGSLTLQPCIDYVDEWVSVAGLAARCWKGLG